VEGVAPGSPKPSIFQKVAGANNAVFAGNTGRCFLNKPSESYSHIGCCGLITDQMSQLVLTVSVIMQRNFAGVSSSIFGSMII